MDKRYIKNLEVIKSTYEGYVTHCNHSIRWARKMLKTYGPKDIYINTIKNGLRSRAETKIDIQRVSEKIRLAACL